MAALAAATLAAVGADDVYGYGVCRSPFPAAWFATMCCGFGKPAALTSAMVLWRANKRHPGPARNEKEVQHTRG